MRILVACTLIACERTPAPPPPTPIPPTPVDAVPPDTAPPPDAWTYPSAAIHAAESEIQRACGRLVYKDGCRVLRRGAVTLSVTLDQTGAQTHVDTIGNTASPDGAQVLACVSKALAAHAFDPPATTTTLTIRFVLADMC
jgi:hypothetical protein